MPIPVICGCKAKLKVADGLLGLNIKCPKCSKTMPVKEPKQGDPYYDLFAAGPENGAPALALLPADEVWAKSPLSEEERERVKEELDVKERILWTGRPDPQVAYKQGWLFAAGFFFAAIMFLVVVIVLNVAQDGKMGNWIINTILILGILFWIGLGAATPFYKRWLAEKQFYTISDKRATIWGCNKFGKKLPPGHFEPAELHGFYLAAAINRGEEAGDLIFGSKTVTRGRGKDATTVTYTWGFFGLKDAKTPEKIIREVLVAPLLDKAYE